MSKRSFKDIEQFIKNAAEANEPAFDEQSWNKMEALLDKDKDNKKPFAFWWLLPLLIAGAGVSYFAFNKNEIKDDKHEITVQKNNDPAKENTNNKTVNVNKNLNEPDEIKTRPNNDQLTAKGNNANAPVSVKTSKPTDTNNNLFLVSAGQNTNEDLFSKKKLAEKAKGKMNAKITSVKPVPDEAQAEDVAASNTTDPGQNQPNETGKEEEVIVVKINGDNTDGKQIEKIVDSVITKSVTDKKSKNRISKFYVIVTGGADASGVKLFSSDKITGRAGLAAGYQLSKNISVQTGFFISNKKYIAGKEDYKTKPGSYWNMVDIKSIDANCKVYEIPLQVRYDFTPGKKLNLFATAGLSSYIMKKEAYNFYYERSGAAHQAGAYYTGNKSLFSVLRLSAGVEKKISKNFSVFASPGIAVPLAGVGEGEVKLYSTDLMIGLKFSPSRKK
jgi:Outer membrane protein beta-barrel domain